MREVNLLGVPFLLNGNDHDHCNGGPGSCEEQDAELEEKNEVADPVPSAASVNSNSAMNMWKGKEANAANTEPIVRTGTVKINTGVSGGGSNSVLQKWKQKEAEAIEKAKRPGGR